MKWNQYRLKTKAEAEDIVSSVLMDAGVEGVQIEDSVPLSLKEKEQMFVDILPEPERISDDAYITFYVREDEEQSAMIDKIQAELSGMRRYMDIGTCEIEVSQTEDEDWINNWKQYFHSFRVDDILITPSWENAKDQTDAGEKPEFVIHMDPGTAFGTGSHETTQLCIRALRKYLKEGDCVLDVGCGSGILGITAIKSGAAGVIGTDLDPCAVSASDSNMNRNDITAEKYAFILGNIISDKTTQEDVHQSSFAKKGCFNVVVANILAEVLVELTPVAADFIAPGGFYITSGILSEKADMVKTCIEESGLKVLEVTNQGEWSAIAARREAE